MIIEFEHNKNKYDYRINDYGEDGLFILDSEAKSYVKTDVSDSLQINIDALLVVESMKQLRQQRGKLLIETDWQASSDLTMSAEQTAYRKALRDLPSTASPELDSDGQLTGVTWPTKE